MAAIDINEIIKLTPDLIKIPVSRLWYEYDKEADVLYINFKKPGRAEDSEYIDDDIIVRYEKDEIIGVTVLHASERTGGD